MQDQTANPINSSSPQYVAGFLSKCAEFGLDETTSESLLKQAGLKSWFQDKAKAVKDYFSVHEIRGPNTRKPNPAVARQMGGYYTKDAPMEYLTHEPIRYIPAVEDAKSALQFVVDRIPDPPSKEKVLSAFTFSGH